MLQLALVLTKIEYIRCLERSRAEDSLVVLMNESLGIRLGVVAAFLRLLQAAFFQDAVVNVSSRWEA